MSMKKGLIALILFTALPLFAGVSSDVRKGDKLLHRKKYGQALTAYERALEKKPSDAHAAFGVGAASYYLKDYENAERAFAAAGAANEKMLQDSLFNMGTSFYRAEDRENAKAAYRQLLLKNPNDKEALHNYQIILEEEKSDNQSDSKSQEKKDDKDQQNSNQQQNQEQNPNQGEDENQEQKPDEQENQDNMNQDDAQRVMQMARDNEYKRKQAGQGQQNLANSMVEKDW